MDSMFSGEKSEETLLISSNLYSREQLQNIFLNRKQYEAKIRKKEKSAIFAYIDQEKSILQKINSSSKCDRDLKQQVIYRIIKIHTIALSHFTEELKIWISYIKFCTEVGNVDLVTNSFPVMLQVHKNDAKLWHLAAKWELNQFNNVDKALNYLYRGLHYNPSAFCLYTQIFKLELMVDNSELDEKEDVDLEELQKESEIKAINVFDLAVKADLDLNLYIELLKIASEFSYTSNIQSRICTFLAKKFCTNEIAWNLLAQRELDGHHLSNDNTYEFITDKDMCTKNCLKKYQYAIKQLPTEKMWEKYLNTLVDLYERSSTNRFIKENFMSACKTAHEKCFMSEKHYMVWLECLNNASNVQEILEFATKHNPYYVNLWSARIRHHFTRKEEHIVETIFNEAIEALGDNSIQIWRRKLQYYQLKCDNHNKIESIFREALDFSNTISLALQPQFLEWVALFRSRDVAHNIYKELSSREPVCIDLHKKMAELEAMCAKPNAEIFEFIKKFMDSHPNKQEEWMEYVTQEIHYGPAWRSEIYKKYLSAG